MSQTERKIAFIAATTLLLSSIEYLIPKPFPFLKLGLANLPILLILDQFGFKAFLSVLLLKAAGQGMVSGTLFSYLLAISLAGTLASGLAMRLTKQLLGSKVSLVGCSVLGAFVSNLAQLEVASLVAYGPSIWIAVPLMLTLGLISSLVLGVFAELYRCKGSFPKHFLDHDFTLSLPRMQNKQHNTMILLASVATIPAILLTKGILSLFIVTALMYLLQILSNRNLRLLPPLLLCFSLVLLSLFEPNGKVLLSVGSIAFTEGALILALTKALRLMSLIAASQCIAAGNPKLTGKAGSVLLLSLTYFSILSSSYANAKGTIIQRIDRSLEHTAQADGENPTQKRQNRPINKPLFVTVSLLVLAVAVYSIIS